MQEGSLSHFYDDILVWPGREANSRPIVWEADTLTTKPTRHGDDIDEVDYNRIPDIILEFHFKIHEIYKVIYSSNWYEHYYHNDNKGMKEIDTIIKLLFLIYIMQNLV